MPSTSAWSSLIARRSTLRPAGDTNRRAQAACSIRGRRSTKPARPSPWRFTSARAMACRTVTSRWGLRAAGAPTGGSRSVTRRRVPPGFRQRPCRTIHWMWTARASPGRSGRCRWARRCTAEDRTAPHSARWSAWSASPGRWMDTTRRATCGVPRTASPMIPRDGIRHRPMSPTAPMTQIAWAR